MKVIDIVNVTRTDDGYELDLGIHTAEVVLYDDGWDVMYNVGDSEYCWEYPDLEEEVENSLWEWLCTLSRHTRPDHSRVLGSYAAFRAA